MTTSSALDAPLNDPTDPSALLVPEGTRLVHIGPNKTGTTSLQWAMHGSRAAMAAQGVHYAGRTHQSLEAVHAVLGQPWHRNDHKPPPIGKWQELVADIRGASEPRVVVSSEGFAGAESDAIRRIVDDLGGAVHVVVTLRPLARILPSQWQQNVQTGALRSYDEWLEERLNGDDPAAAGFWLRHRHDRLIARWAEVVGAQNTTAVVVDERDHGHVLRVFERLVGLREGTLVADPRRINRSMTMPEIEAIRALNIAIRSGGHPKRLQSKVVRLGVARLMKQREPGPAEPRVDTPQWALERAGEIAREMVQAIADSGVRVVGDLHGLTEVPRSGLAGDRQPEVCIPPDVAASMAMGVLVVGGLVADPSRASADAGTGAGPSGTGSWREPPELAVHSTGVLARTVAGRMGRGAVRRLARIRRRIGAAR